MAYFRASILEYIRESEAVLAAEELTDHEKDAVEAMLNRLAEIAIV